MTVTVVFRDEPGHVLDVAGGFLGSSPVVHNLMLTLLHARVTVPEPGRYWVAADGDEVVGVVFQSPADYPAAVTPIPAGAVAAIVAAVTGAGVELPGVNGDPATVARFAGSWTEHHRSGARPVDGQRIYEVDRLVSPTGVPGRLRPARADDRDLLVDWLRRFSTEIAGIGPGDDPAIVVERRLPAGHFWVWDDDGPVSMAAHSEPTCGVARIQAVYTPADQRRRGYAGACVAALSARVLDAGRRCILYTDLANPTSNGVYRRIGYRAVAEGLRYEFT